LLPGAVLDDEDHAFIDTDQNPIKRIAFAGAAEA
jgi:hypothetical protein